VAHGERWKFTEMDSRTECFLRGRPVFLNRAKIVPETMRPGRLGLMEDFDYMTCVSVFADGFERWPDLCGAMNAAIERSEGIRGAATTLSRGGCVARFLARSASDMTFASKKLWDVARERVAGLPPFDQRKY